MHHRSGTRRKIDVSFQQKNGQGGDADPCVTEVARVSDPFDRHGPGRASYRERRRDRITSCSSSNRPKDALPMASCE